MRPNVFYLCFSINSVSFCSEAPTRSATLAVLVEVERWHRGDALFGADLLDLVDIDLQKHDICVLVALLLEERRDALARAAPSGEKVNNDELVVRTLDLFVVRVQRVDVDDVRHSGFFFLD